MHTHLNWKRPTHKCRLISICSLIQWLIPAYLRFHGLTHLLTPSEQTFKEDLPFRTYCIVPFKKYSSMGRRLSVQCDPFKPSSNARLLLALTDSQVLTLCQRFLPWYWHELATNKPQSNILVSFQGIVKHRLRPVSSRSYKIWPRSQTPPTFTS